MSPTPSRHDVIVVGARAAGAATAMLLAQTGLSVLLVDRGRYGADTLSTHALMRGGVLQLHRWGLVDQIVAAGTPPIRNTTFRYADGDIVVGMKNANGVDALYAPRRTVLDPILVDAAAAAGAQVHYGRTVADVIRDDRGRVIGVEGRDHLRRRFASHADLVIGADGRSSVIAARVDAPILHAGTSHGGYVYGYWANVETDSYEWAYRRGVAAGFIPTNDGLTCVFAGGSPRRVGRGGRRMLDTIVAHASPDMAARLTAATAPVGVRSFPGRAGYLRQAWGPGWALVGDAGYWKDPISAHGLTDALRDAELLARAVIATTTGDANEGDALAGYQHLRDSLSMPLFTVTDTISAYQWNDTEIPTLLRQMATAMTDEVDTLAALDAPQLTIGATS